MLAWVPKLEPDTVMVDFKTGDDEVFDRLVTTGAMEGL